MLRKKRFEIEISIIQLKIHRERMCLPCFVQTNQSRNRSNRLQTNRDVVHFTREFHTKREHLEIVYQRNSTRWCLRNQRQDRIQRKTLMMIQHEQLHYQYISTQVLHALQRNTHVSQFRLTQCRSCSKQFQRIPNNLAGTNSDYQEEQ